LGGSSEDGNDLEGASDGEVGVNLDDCIDHEDEVADIMGANTPPLCFSFLTTQAYLVALGSMAATRFLIQLSAALKPLPGAVPFPGIKFKAQQAFQAASVKGCH
jgi:hypothetical protein